MRIFNRKDDFDERVSQIEDVDNNQQEVESSRGKTKTKANSFVSDIMGGDVLSKDSFVNLFPFFLYVVLLSMIYITNVYVAEDMSRAIARLNRKAEDLHVEYVYLQSEITKVTKQSNMVDMLKNKGIKESVEPLKKIVVREKGGADED